MNWETIMCLGDSITIGARSYLGYPEYAAAYLAISTERYWNVVNEAVSGETAIQLARRVQAHFESLKHSQPGLVTIMIGTNDVKTNTDVTDFKIAYEQVIIKAKLLCQHVVILGIPNFPRGVMYPYQYDMNYRVNQMNMLLKNLAKRHNVLFWEFTYKAEYFIDGVHLSPKGSKIVGMQLADKIMEVRGL